MLPLLVSESSGVSHSGLPSQGAQLRAWGRIIQINVNPMGLSLTYQVGKTPMSLPTVTTYHLRLGIRTMRVVKRFFGEATSLSAPDYRPGRIGDRTEFRVALYKIRYSVYRVMRNEAPVDILLTGTSNFPTRFIGIPGRLPWPFFHLSISLRFSSGQTNSI